jgi:ribonuclease HI
MCLEIYIDGSHRRQKAGYSFLVLNNGRRIHAEAGSARPWRDGFPGRVRSNDCEIFAAMRALDWLGANAPGKAAAIVTDSQTVADILSLCPADPYVAHLQDRVKAQAVQLRKIKAHAGITHNEAADRMARKARAVKVSLNASAHNELLPSFVGAEPESHRRVRIRLVEFHVAHHCNLTCQGCSHFSPSAPARTIPSEEIVNQFRLAGARLDPEFVHILGGEPLLHPDLKSILPWARCNFPKATIKLVTNGVLFNRRARELIPVISAADIVVAVSIYPGVAVNREAITQTCAAANAKVEFWVQDTFVDFLDLAGASDPVAARADCPMNDALNVRGDRLYPCPVTAWSDFGGAPQMPGDGISLHDSAATLAAVLDRRRVTSKCHYCRPVPLRRPHAMGDRKPFLAPSPQADA